jgi:hypothetical protein
MAPRRKEHPVRLRRPPKPSSPLGDTKDVVVPLFVSHSKISLTSYLEEEEKKSHDDDVVHHTNITNPQLPPSRTCMPHLFRGRKIRAADVASIGLASDTLVNGHLVGRSIHEDAKEALNEGRFHEALKLFESILTAQVRRFGPCHPSVAAAMHNVAGE